MTPIFATLTVALAAVLVVPRRFAVAIALLCLVLSMGLFLFEIHSAEDGFRMPWIQVRAEPTAPRGPA